MFLVDVYSLATVWRSAKLDEIGAGAEALQIAPSSSSLATVSLENSGYLSQLFSLSVDNFSLEHFIC